MNEIEGSWFDGGSSRRRGARLRWGSGALALLPEEGGRISIDPQRLQMSSPLPGAPTRLSWGGEDSFVTMDETGVAAMRRDLALGGGWLSRLENRMSVAVGGGMLCVSLLVAFAFWGVPAIAARAAFLLPVEVSDDLGDLLLGELESWLPPSELTEARQAGLVRYFTSRDETDASPRVEFRASEIIGANALTLSATTVAFTDDLVMLAENDQELLAVYFHELGHAELRHVEQKVLTASAWLVMFALFTGDIGVVGDLLLGSVLLGPALGPFSRALEREADAFAVERLLAAGESPEAMISILEKLEAQSGLVVSVNGTASDENGSNRDDPAPDAAISEAEITVSENTDEGFLLRLLDIIASHPPTTERIQYIESRIAD